MIATAQKLQYLDFKGWLYGFFHAAIGGGSTAVVGGFSASVIKPQDFGMFGANSLKLMAMMFSFNFILSAFYYLKDSPLPNIVESATTTVTVTKTSNTIKDNPIEENKP